MQREAFAIAIGDIIALLKAYYRGGGEPSWQALEDG
jgi:hypothetical protein